MRSNNIEIRHAEDEPKELQLRDLRRIVTRHRSDHNRAELAFHEWRTGWAVNERVMDEQLTRIRLQLTNRLDRLALL